MAHWKKERIEWLTVSFKYLNIQLGLLQLEVVFFAPALFRLHHWSQSVELDHAVIDDFVTVIFKSDTHLERFSCKPIRNDQWVLLAVDFSVGEQPRLTLSRLKDQLAISTSQSTTRGTSVVNTGCWKDSSDSPHFRRTILSNEIVIVRERLAEHQRLCLYWSYLKLNCYGERLSESDFFHFNEVKENVFVDLGGREIINIRGSIDSAHIVDDRRYRNAFCGRT